MLDLDIEVQREEAFEDGMTAGIEKGTNRINELNSRLIEEGRLEDLQKAAKDKEYQKKLMEELGIVD